MKKRQQELAAKVGRLTQRLDFKLLDPDLSVEENARASAELASLAARLAAIVPDPTLSVEERLERLARPVVGATAIPLEADAKKLARLKTRLDELVPDGDLSAERKVEKLEKLFHAAGLKEGRDVA